jgi:hypothetical protein
MTFSCPATCIIAPEHTAVPCASCESHTSANLSANSHPCSNLIPRPTRKKSCVFDRGRTIARPNWLKCHRHYLKTIDCPSVSYRAAQEAR